MHFHNFINLRKQEFVPIVRTVKHTQCSPWSGGRAMQMKMMIQIRTKEMMSHQIMNKLQAKGKWIEF